jgi:hypothetical protein
MASEERYLWVMQYLWHGKSRMWWAYFKDWSEIQGNYTAPTHLI